MIESIIRKQLEQKDILLMTHIVIGYPSPEVSYQIVKAMVEIGVDLMELQIPFFPSRLPRISLTFFWRVRL
jgi:tryptophan synthase alpha chain